MRCVSGELQCDFSTLRHVDLPELVTVLNWCSHRVATVPTTSVEWTYDMRPGADDTESVESLRFNAILDVGEEKVKAVDRTIGRLVERCSRGEVWPRDLDEALKTLFQPYKNST